MRELGVSPTTVRIAVAELTRAQRIETIPGNGTFIAHVPAAASSPTDRTWQTVALGSNHPGPDLLGPLRSPPAPDTIDLASGYPEPSLHPTSLLTKAVRDAVRRQGTFDRAPSIGLGPLRDWFAEQITATRDHDVLITPGGQDALSLIFRSLGLTGDAILMETPTYVGAIAAARAAGLVPVPVPTDADGVLIGELEDAANRTGATLLYIQPRFHNPTGAILAEERRQPLMDIASRHNLIIVEDDWLYDLDEPRTRLAPLAANDPDGHVVHVRSLTKSVAPALRIAGVAATGAIAQRIRTTRGAEDFFVSPILQETALNVVTNPAWGRHLRQMRLQLQERQLLLRQGLGDAFEADPVGGPLHLWIETPGGNDPDELRAAALRHGVAIVSGVHWHPGDAPARHIRLSNAAAVPERIADGMARLGESLAVS